MINKEDKEYIRECIERINAEEFDDSLREAAGEELISMIYKTIGDHERIDYNGCIYNMYINYNSNCGLTIVEANIDFETIADYILQNEDINTITLEDAVNIMHGEFPERNEFWDDLIDENGYTVDEEHIISVLEYLMEEQDNCDEEFRQDLKDYKNRR